jgi:ABC-type sugar transport system permease subunit
MGFAASMAFLLAAIIFVFTFIQRRLIERGTEQY